VNAVSAGFTATPGLNGLLDVPRAQANSAAFISGRPKEMRSFINAPPLGPFATEDRRIQNDGAAIGH